MTNVSMSLIISPSPELEDAGQCDRAVQSPDHVKFEEALRKTQLFLPSPVMPSRSLPIHFLQHAYRFIYNTGSDIYIVARRFCLYLTRYLHVEWAGTGALADREMRRGIGAIDVPTAQQDADIRNNRKCSEPLYSGCSPPSLTRSSTWRTNSLWPRSGPEHTPIKPGAAAETKISRFICPYLCKEERRRYRIRGLFGGRSLRGNSTPHYK